MVFIVFVDYYYLRVIVGVACLVFWRATFELHFIYATVEVQIVQIKYRPNIKYNYRFRTRYIHMPYTAPLSNGSAIIHIFHELCLLLYIVPFSFDFVVVVVASVGVVVIRLIRFACISLAILFEKLCGNNHRNSHCVYTLLLFVCFVKASCWRFMLTLFNILSPEN